MLDGLHDIYIFITNDIPNVLNISLEGEKMAQPELVWSVFIIFQIIRNIFQIEL